MVNIMSRENDKNDNNNETNNDSTENPVESESNLDGAFRIVKEHVGKICGACGKKLASNQNRIVHEKACRKKHGLPPTPETEKYIMKGRSRIRAF
jgi:hypothetical protein